MTAAHEGWPLTPERRRERSAPPQAGCDDGACWCYPTADGPVGEVPPAVVAYESRIDVGRAEIVRLTGERDAAVARLRQDVRNLDSDVQFWQNERDEWKVAYLRELARADAAEARLRAVEATLHDLAEHGTGFDLNPTVDGDDTWAYVRYIERMDDRVREIASAALSSDAAPQAAGVTRSITTAAELAALPVDAVIRTAGETVFERMWDDGWERPGHAMEWTSAEVAEDYLPAVVLYIPVADAPAAPEGER